MNQSWLTPEMRKAIPTVQHVFKQFAPEGFVVEFTSGKEWFHHSLWSLHHSGNAVDIRTRTLPDHGVGATATRIAGALQHSLDSLFGASRYRVLLNDAGPSKPHVHVQYNKGGRWSEPGDFDIDGQSRVA